MTRLICTLAATVLFTVPALAQTILEGGRLESPILGRFFDPQVRAIRTLNGVPGASSASAAVESDAVRYAVSAPHRAWAIVDRAAAGTLELMTFSRSGPALRGISAAKGVDQIAFSPSGDAAILYYRGSRAEIWKSFSSTPECTAVYSLDGLTGEAASLGVADDATVAALILNSGENAQLYSLRSSSSSVNKIGGASAWSAFAFAPNSKVAYAANRDTNEISQFLNFGSDGASGVVAAAADGVLSPAALAVSGDGRKLIVANQDDPSVAVIDLDTRRSIVLTLERAADGLYALEGNAVFQLSASSKPEIFLLDADGAEARITVASVQPALVPEAATNTKTAAAAAKGGQ